MADVVRMTGISTTTINNMYHDRVTKVHYGIIEKLCIALDCTPGDLLVFDPSGYDGFTQKGLSDMDMTGRGSADE